MDYEIVSLNSSKLTYLPSLTQLKAIETKSLDEKILSEISAEDLKRSQEFIETLLDQNSDFLLAMIDDKTPIGYCVGQEDAFDEAIYRSTGVFVREHYREEGVGRELLKRQIQECRNFEYEHITTTTTLQNAASQNLLERLEFELEAEMGGVLEYTLRI